jgi:type 1 glutamine amidotransferase
MAAYSGPGQKDKGQLRAAHGRFTFRVRSEATVTSLRSRIVNSPRLPVASCERTINGISAPYTVLLSEEPAMRTLLLATAASLLLTAATSFAAPPKEVKVLIITGDAVPAHKWKETTAFLKDLLTKAGHKVDVTETPSKDLTPANLARYDVFLLNYKDTPQGAKDNPASVWSADNKKALREAVQNGKGLVVYHHASSAFAAKDSNDKEFEQLVAGGWRNQGNHGKMHEFLVTVRKDHPITHGIHEFKHGRDELYQNSVMLPGSQVLATAYSEKSKDPKNTGKDEPVIWVANFGKGRVVENVLGHDVEAMQDPTFQQLMVRGIEWAATVGDGVAPATGKAIID